MNTTEKLKEVYQKSNDESLVTIIEEMSISDEHAFRSHMTKLLLHICKWELQPERRSRSWSFSIVDAQNNIQEWLEDSPSLKSKIEKNWNKALLKLPRLIKAETGQEAKDWSITFEKAMKFNPEL